MYSSWTSIFHLIGGVFITVYLPQMNEYINQEIKLEEKILHIYFIIRVYLPINQIERGRFFLIH